ncbi:penicillin acylase family protein [Portibacter marinus]|uniref:penicillin acylase family protein n=1 Tax=Portibacter marinus TaxID=2898660 RepID=UPI001F29F824|nr:penicillin acylase family protein [Portibacter marinus]
MLHFKSTGFILCLLCFFAESIDAQIIPERLTLDQLDKEVEILVDEWGIAHIYAQTEHDLFFTQGWNAARDRLFQFEIWRRQAEGTVAEILGPEELQRDIGTRLFKFRGNMDDEMNHYHPRGKSIITAFVDGVNAYIDLANKKPEELPLEFKLLGIQPVKWTPEVVISRHQGLLGNIDDELDVARQVAAVGVDKTLDLNFFHPKEPKLALDSTIKKEWLDHDILELYNAYRKPVAFRKENLVSAVNEIPENKRPFNEFQNDQSDYSIGSNNWVITGEHTVSGFPIMANDPHRRQSVPSLRYMCHLVGPGWNVIGGGEPEIPGISIGHNGVGAWGLTVFRTDAEDLYVYELNPSDQNQYWHNEEWVDFDSIVTMIPVKGAQDYRAVLKYSIHGPVVYSIEPENVAFAVKCGWMEVGGAPYLASLRMNQSQNFEEFREACNYSNIPGENMIWADRSGNIGWQSVGIAPLRRNFSGMVPVPGDGRFEWDGYLPIIEKPNIYNPESGFFITANENVTPSTYTEWDAIGYSWADRFRGDRIHEVLSQGGKFSMMDMARLQTDYKSIPATQLIPLLRGVKSNSPEVKYIMEKLLNWEDFELNPESVSAAIYVEWESVLKQEFERSFVPVAIRDIYSVQMSRLIDLLTFPDGRFGENIIAGRDAFLRSTLRETSENLKDRLGDDTSQWQYGQLENKHIFLEHALGQLVSDSIAEKLNVGPHIRGGNGYTVGSTGNNLNQSSGASFKVIIDTGNWDGSLFMNSPGQSGNPDSAFYDNLFEDWASDRYYPLFYSREKVVGATAKKILLNSK